MLPSISHLQPFIFLIFPLLFIYLFICFPQPSTHPLSLTLSHRLSSYSSRVPFPPLTLSIPSSIISPFYSFFPPHHCTIPSFPLPPCSPYPSFPLTIIPSRLSPFSIPLVPVPLSEFLNNCDVYNLIVNAIRQTDNFNDLGNFSVHQ